jgi:glucose/mannose transport system permease protein
MQNRKERLQAFFMVLPSILAVAIFIYGFIGWTVRVSFTSWKGMIPDYTWVGLQNYINLLTNDPRFQVDVRNTLLFTIPFVFGTWSLD